jgi:hypothetical protein
LIPISLRTWGFLAALAFLWLPWRAHEFWLKLNLNFSELFIKFIVLIHVLRKVGKVGKSLMVTLNAFILIWCRVHSLITFYWGLLLNFHLVLAFKVHQRDFSVVPACTRTRSLEFICHIKWMEVRRRRLLETLIMRLLILNLANLAKNATIVCIFRILKCVWDGCWMIHAFGLWINFYTLILKILNLSTSLAWGISVIN